MRITEEMWDKHSKKVSELIGEVDNLKYFTFDNTSRPAEKAALEREIRYLRNQLGESTLHLMPKSVRDLITFVTKLAELTDGDTSPIHEAVNEIRAQYKGSR